MAITRIYQTGFELGTLAQENVVLGAIAIDSAQKKTGAYSFRFTYMSSYIWWAIPSTRQVRVGGHFRTNGANYSNQEGELLSIDAASPLTSLVEVRVFDKTHLRLYVAGTLIGSYPIAMNTWYHIGCDVNIDSVNGWAKLYLDGVEVISSTGNTGNSDIESVHCGDAIGARRVGDYSYVDDLTIDDTTGEAAPAVVPDLRYTLLKPNGAGGYTQWTPSAGSNYTCVDDVPPAGSDYVSALSAGLLDSYALGDFAAQAGSQIAALIPIAVCLKDDAGVASQVSLGTRLSATDLIGSPQNPPTSYNKVLFERQATKPGGSAWSETDVNNAEVVIKSEGTF